MRAGVVGGTDPRTFPPTPPELCSTSAMFAQAEDNDKTPSVFAANTSVKLDTRFVSSEGGAMGGTSTIGAVTHIEVASPVWAAQKAVTAAANLVAP